MASFEKRNKFKPIPLIMVVVGLIFCLFFYSYDDIVAVRSLPDNIILSQSEVNSLSLSNISCSVSSEATVAAIDTPSSIKKLKFKLFNLFPLKTVNAVVEPERKAYIGGYPVGLSIKAKGVIVVSRAEINTTAGRVLPPSDVLEGDIITHMNGIPVLYTSQIVDKMLSFSKDDRFIEFKVIRSGRELSVASYPVIEEFTNNFKLGLAVKDCAEGIGTVSYVKQDGRFGSLGHSISGANNSAIDCMEGTVYECKLMGYNKGGRGVPGELKGSFANTQNPIGRIDINNNFGVFGRLNNTYSDDLYEIGSRLSVKNGKAKMITTIADKPVSYDIEIIKTLAQSSPQEKGMIIRVTDARLLNTTGGILQGMSGSPIIQNGKIVATVTHVMLSDSTKGYAVYLDWMYPN